MIDRAKARRIAKAISNPGDSDWNKIAHFAETGEVDPGLSTAVRDYRRTEPNVGGHPANGLNDHDTLDLAKFADGIEAEGES